MMQKLFHPILFTLICAAPGEVLRNGYILSHYAKYASGMTRIKVEV